MRDQPTSNREAELPAITRIGSGDLLGDGKTEQNMNESKPCSTEWIGDEDLTCGKCGKKGVGLFWPTPILCDDCDEKTPAACPFCGCRGVWRVKENDSTAFWLECSVCHARGPRVELEGMAEHQWNRRKSPNVEVSDDGSR